MPRFSMEVTPAIAQMLRGWAAEHDTSVGDLVGRGIQAVGLVRAARERGLPHVGFTSNPKNLDAELRGLFPEQPHIVIAS